MKSNYFNFKKFQDRYLISNEQGRYYFLRPKDFEAFVKEDYAAMDPKVVEDLKDRFFLYDSEESVFVEKAMEAYRGNKQYIFNGTCLHIFVLTNACNMCCVYCQAQDSSQELKGIMDEDTARKAVEIALQSPEHYLTFEFQGGEPLIHFEMLRFIVEYSEARKNDKEIQYSLVTNTLLLTDEMIRFFKQYDISVSTSLDGHQPLHDHNRPMRNGGGTFEIVRKNVKRLQDAGVHAGAIQTTTKQSLEDPGKIIQAYLEMGFDHLFIRPLTPLGYAKEHWDEIGYEPEEFVDFYRKILRMILECNKKGLKAAEGHAGIFLRKIIAGYSDNYMELRSPCGAAVGQMAYYYDGNIYTCDEGRMVAEMGDSMFCLGNVRESSYDELMDHRICKVTCQASVLEALPGCCDCVYHPYCGVCPVINYASNQNIYERQANSYRCRIYKGMLDTIFEILFTDSEAFQIFESWV